METTVQDEKLCKICHSICDENIPFVHPCKCKGSLKYIHVECLNEWIRLSNARSCGICKYPFKFNKKFKDDTPKNVPIYYVIAFVLKTFWSGVLKLIGFLYFLIGITIAMGFNTGIFIFYFLGKEASLSSNVGIILSFPYIAFNVAHFAFIKKTLKHASSVRPRIRSSSVLQDLVNDVSTRSAADLSVTVSQSRPNQDSETDDSAESSPDVSTVVQFNINLFFGRTPSIENIKCDLAMLCMLSTVSITYPIIYHLSELISFVAVRILDFNSWKRYLASVFPNAIDFSNSVHLESFFLRMLGVFVFFSLLIWFVHVLKINTTSRIIKEIFYLLKCYLIMIPTGIVIAYTMGISLHFTLSRAFNKGKAICIFDTTYVSTLLHIVLGIIMVVFKLNFNDKLRKKFRPGLMLKTIKNNSFGATLDRCYAQKLPQFAVSVLGNLVATFFVLFIVTSVSKVSMDFTFEFKERIWSFFFFKSVYIMSQNINIITKSMVNLVVLIVKIVSKPFDADNYLFNTEMAVPNKRMLVWAPNVKYLDGSQVQQIARINRLIQKDQAGIDASEISSQNNLSQHEESTRANSDELTLISKRTQSKATSTLINSINQTESARILDKYSITSRRIQKYYAKTHTRKVSIFYRPKFYNLFKILCIVACMASICAILHLLLRVSFLICKITPLKRTEAKTVLFVHSACLLIVSLAHAPEFYSKSIQQISNHALNVSILSAYTNIVFPFVGSTAYVVMNASRNSFSGFTSAFLVLNSFSFIVTFLFETFFLFSPISTYHYVHVFKQLLSFLVLKFGLFFAFVAYTRLIVFTSIYIPMFFTCVAVIQIVKIVRVLFSGTLMETIKDHFFLDQTTVINYNYSDDE